MRDFLEDLDSFPGDEKAPLEDWEPKPDERSWYRNAASGNRGFMVRRAGIDQIKLDRPNEDITQPYNESQWQPDEETRPLSIAATAQIAFAADRKLAFYTGRHDVAKVEWLELREEARIEWIKKGPPGELRQMLFKTIMGALQPWTK